MDNILNPWPWYISGPLIALVMIALVFFGKTFGMSSNLRTLCTLGGAGKHVPFFKINWKDYAWNLCVAIGGILGGYIAVNFLSNNSITDLDPNLATKLITMGFNNPGTNLIPQEIYGFEAITTLKGLSILIIGGLLVGFGTRYAGGCSSGHGITGLSSLQKASFIAVLGFFIGGVIMTHLILPLLF